MGKVWTRRDGAILSEEVGISKDGFGELECLKGS